MNLFISGIPLVVLNCSAMARPGPPSSSPSSLVSRLEAELAAARREEALALSTARADAQLAERAAHGVVNYDRFKDVGDDEDDEDDGTSFEKGCWYVLAGGPKYKGEKVVGFDEVEKRGPFDLRAMKEMFDKGDINKDTPCYLHGSSMRRFQKMATLKDLSWILEDVKANMSGQERVASLGSAPCARDDDGSTFLSQLDARRWRTKQAAAKPLHAYLSVQLAALVAVVAAVYLCFFRPRSAVTYRWPDHQLFESEFPQTDTQA